VDGNPATAVTDADGYYFIDALLPGDYVAQFELPDGLDGWVFTPPGADDVERDSNPGTLTGVTPVFTIAPRIDGETIHDIDDETRAIYVNPTIDAGVVPLVGVGDFVWIDANRNGIQDSDELPLSGVVVALELPDGTPAVDVEGNEVTAVTDDNGFYFMDALLPGDYVMRFTIADGYQFTESIIGDPRTDSNPSPTSDDPLVGVTGVFTLTAGVSGQMVEDVNEATLAVFVNPTIDAGVVVIEQPARVAGSRLPSTGFTDAVLALVALGLLLLGFTLLMLGRRRVVVGV